MNATRIFGLTALALVLGACGAPQARDSVADEAQPRDETLAEPRDNRARAAAHEGEHAGGEVEAPPGQRLRVDASNAPARGARDPLVTIVMFSDFQCPFCSRVEPTLDRLLEEFPREVRIVWRNNPLPFHQEAMPAAEAAMEAYAQGGDALFWRYHALLFENQRALSRADLERYGASAGLDPVELVRALDAHTHRARIEADQGIAARVGARGTPAFFINGRVLMGAQPYEQFATLVREEIATARRAMEGGVRQGELYAYFMRHAQDTPPPAEPTAPEPARPIPDPNAVYRIPVDGRPARGRADALVTIVMFSEFQCPFCARALPTLEQIAERYGDDVRFVFRHNPLPFHQNAMPAAIAAEEVFRQRGARVFFRYHDLLFENQQSLERETLLDLAARVGARRRDVERALDEDRGRDVILADQELARSVGASGTPTFFINGRMLRGAQPFPAFQALIDEERESARARVADGTPRRRLYETIIENGATSPQTIEGPARPSVPPPGSDTVYSISVPRTAPSRGPANARVTIQLFSDFECPFCNRIRPTLDRILQEYPRDVRVVWRDYPLPFHTNAMPAAEAAREVFRQGGNDAFWRYHDLVFENQRSLDTDTLVRLAGEVPGVNAAQVRRALERETHRAAVEADMAAISNAGVRIGTPSTFINGRLVQGAQPFAAFRAAIERALAEAP